MSELKLTVKQEKFCNKYLECGNASEAYRFAYDCKNMKDETIAENASRLLKNSKVIARLKYLKNNLSEAAGISALRVIREYEKIAFSSIAHLHNTWIERKDFEDLTDEQKACIKSIQTKTQRRVLNEEPVEIEHVKVELHDKLSALTEIKKMLGYDAPVKSEVKMETVTVRYE